MYNKKRGGRSINCGFFDFLFSSKKGIMKLYIGLIVLFVIIIVLFLSFFFLKQKPKPALDEQLSYLDSYLENCKLVNEKENPNLIIGCKAFFNEDQKQCELVNDLGFVERCKSSILSFNKAKEIFKSDSCDNFDADNAWCNAIKSEDIRFCEDIIDEESRIFCKSKIGKNINICDDMNAGIECDDMFNHQKAFILNDSSLCNNIFDLSLKNACIANLLNLDDIDNILYDYRERKLFVLFSAFLLRSNDLCLGLEESDARSMCLALANLNVNECQNALNKDYCREFYLSNERIYNNCIENGMDSLCIDQIIKSSSY